VALTFVAVVVGWVFFRAENFQAAWNMLAGMAGLHGVSVPASLDRHLSRIVSPTLHSSLRFDGFIPSASIPSIVFVTLIFGFILVWAFPNLQRLLERYKSTEHPPREPFPVIVWKGKTFPIFFDPNVVFAISAGVIFFMAVLAIGAGGPSEFLYFEF
jgi:hypothetical protein